MLFRSARLGRLGGGPCREVASAPCHRCAADHSRGEPRDDPRSISIKRWNGSTWEIEKSISDQLGSNKKLHTMNYSTTISGGYNYKLTVNHYAKASGLFGGSQSVFNETSYIWIA